MSVTGRYFIRIVVLAAIFSVAYYIGRNAPASPDSIDDTPMRVYQGYAMGTSLMLKMRTDDEKLATDASDKVMDEMQRLTSIFHPDDSTSELFRINKSRGSGEWLEISPEMYEVLEVAFEVRDQSDGYFEPAIGDLVRLWGFNDRRKSAHIPDSSDIKALLDSTIWSYPIEIKKDADGQRILMGRGAGMLELGGIAKGYAVDRAAYVLKEQGIGNGLVNLGGEISVIGKGSNGRSWRVGVQHPREEGDYVGVLELKDGMTVATSGDYENFIESGGRKFHHILNPRTGFPAFVGSVETTVIGKTCFWSDAYATAVFVLGPQNGIKLADKEGIAAMIIYIVDGESEEKKLDYAATASFLKVMKPSLEGLPIN